MNMTSELIDPLEEEDLTYVMKFIQTLRRTDHDTLLINTSMMTRMVASTHSRSGHVTSPSDDYSLKFLGLYVAPTQKRIPPTPVKAARVFDTPKTLSDTES